MIIGIGRITLILPGSRSLKQKRGVINSVKSRIRNNFNVSVMEDESHDLHGQSVIVVASISRNGKILQKTFDQVEESLDKRKDLVVTSYEIEIES